MKIRVREIPTCTWVLEGEVFWCTHDVREVVDYTNLYMADEGPEEYTTEGYECAECGEPLEGSPEID